MNAVGLPGHEEVDAATVPADWVVLKIGEMTEVSAGGTPATGNESYWFPPEVPWMSSGEVHKRRIYSTEKKISTLGLNNSAAKVFPKKSVVMALAGQGKTRGGVAVLEAEVATNQSLAAIYPSKAFDTDFLFHNLDWRYKELRSLSSGEGGRGGLNLSIIKSVPIGLPPLPEQQKIAAILTAVDDKLDVIARQIEASQTLKHGLMQTLFSRGIGTHHAADWPTVSLCEVAEVRTGVAKGKKGLQEPVELPYLRVANVQDGHIDLAEVKNIEVEATQVERYALQPGDVLMTEGGDFDKLGRGDVWEGQISPCLHQNHVFAVRPEPGKLNSYYLAALAASDHGRQYFLSCAKRTTNLASINSSQLKAFPVLLPSISVQESIAEVVDSANAKVAVLEEKQERYQTLKRGLMQRLLTGEWRVSLNASATGT